MTARRLFRTGAVGLATAATLATGPAGAQEDGGRRLTGVVSQRVEAGSNLAFRPGEDRLGARSVTTLGLGFLTETRTQSFALDATISARSKVIGDEDDTSDSLRVLPTVELTYGIEGWGLRRHTAWTRSTRTPRRRNTRSRAGSPTS